MKVRLSCQEVSRLLSAQQDADLPAAERARMRLHLVMCEACRNVDEQMAFIRQAMRRLGDDAPPVSPPPAPTPEDRTPGRTPR